MPPHVPRKRLREDSFERETTNPVRKKAKSTPNTKRTAPSKPGTATTRKATLFDDLDRPAIDNKAFLGDSESDDSSLSSLSEDEFEDVASPKSKAKESNKRKSKAAADEDEDSDVVFEDVAYETLAPQKPDTDIDLTLTHIEQEQWTAGKKGPSKSERRTRINTHCMHVQYLMWHNATRNGWLCDPWLHGILLSHLPPAMWDEVTRWRKNCGLPYEEEVKIVNGQGVRGRPQVATKGKPPARQPKGKQPADKKRSRDWDHAAQRLEKGKVDMSHGDPLFRLLRALSSWWRQRFRVTAPGLRKRGYIPVRQCNAIIKAFGEGKYDLARHGERVEDLDWFRHRAQLLCGSRDVGAQLFTALLRALDIEARMVANLQPVGYGWTRAEIATSIEEQAVMCSAPVTPPPEKTTRKRKASAQKPVINLDSDEDVELGLGDSDDDDSVVEISRPTKPKGPVFDKDLEFPHYWTEAMSPITNIYTPIDVMVKKALCTSRELVESLEPRGQRAEAAKQIMAYVVGHSPDGSAKDITVRYLKGQMFPGRTKGLRMPIEKVPIYNKHGKVKRYEQFDWFRALMRDYLRGTDTCPLTDADEIEDTTDLRPVEPRKREVKEGEETLQYYKQSKDYVLERHFRREEAILPGAEPVKYFHNKPAKKGTKSKDTTPAPEGGEPVYLRSDIVAVKSAETWHKQGRAPKPGEQPLKRAPYRVATTTRRRQLAELEAKTGEKALQGLYSYEQTDWIIPPPIKDGVIPKNEYGNIDLFVEHMLPKGAVHLPYRTAMRVCKRMGIDYAEAVVDFDFGHRMAVPVINGVVIAAEHHKEAMEEIEKEEAERARKEDEKKRKVVLAMWRKLMMGLRIVERVKREHGHLFKDSFHAFGHEKDEAAAIDGDDDAMEGGFLPEGFEYEAADKMATKGPETSAFFATGPPASQDVAGDDEEEDQDMLVVDHGIDGQDTSARVAYPTPQSAEADEVKPHRKSAASRRNKRSQVSDSSTDAEDNDAGAMSALSVKDDEAEVQGTSEDDDDDDDDDDLSSLPSDLGSDSDFEG